MGELSAPSSGTRRRLAHRRRGRRRCGRWSASCSRTGFRCCCGGDPTTSRSTTIPTARFSAQASRGRSASPVSECWSEIWHILQPLIDTPFQRRPGDLERGHPAGDQPPRLPRGDAFHDRLQPGSGRDACRGHRRRARHRARDHREGRRRAARRRAAGPRRARRRREDGRGGLRAVAARTLSAHEKDVPFVLLYLIDGDGRSARLAASSGVAPGSDISPPTIDLRQRRRSRLAVRCGAPQRRVAGGALAGRAVCHGAAGPVVRSARTPRSSCRSRRTRPHEPPGLIVAGVSARLKFDDDYRDFFELVADAARHGRRPTRAPTRKNGSAPKRWPRSTARRRRSSATSATSSARR